MSEPSAPPRTEEQRGTIFGFSAYLIWGIFPLYFHLLQPAGAIEVLAHRILWTLLVCVVALAVLPQLGGVRELLAEPRRLTLIALAGGFIAVNWGLYVYAVEIGQVSAAALGYFLNPLVTVALGVVVLRESLRPLQWAAVAVGLLAAIYLTVDYGSPPWISLALAFSFATYGLLKNKVGARTSAIQGLSAETMVLAVPAVVMLVVLHARGGGTFTEEGPGHALLLASSGVATAIPLLLFAAAARRVTLVTIGLMQFVTPVLQLICGVVLLGEHVPTGRWIGFGIVWVALVLLTTDTVLHARRGRRLARAARGAAG